MRRCEKRRSVICRSIYTSFFLKNPSLRRSREKISDILIVGPLRGPHSSKKKKKKKRGVRRTRGDVEPCCLRSMSCGRTTQPRLANTTVPVFCRWVACHCRLCNSTYDLKQKKGRGRKKNAEGLKRIEKK